MSFKLRLDIVFKEREYGLLKNIFELCMVLYEQSKKKRKYSLSGSRTQLSRAPQYDKRVY